MKVKAYVVNGQPIKVTDLTSEQLNSLRSEDFTFVVHKGDAISGLGIVFYIDKIVEGIPGDPHTVVGVSFDEKGNFSKVDPEGPSFLRDINNDFWLALLIFTDGTQNLLATIAEKLITFTMYVDKVYDEVLFAIEDFGRYTLEIANQVMRKVVAIMIDALETTEEIDDQISRFIGSAALLIIEFRDYLADMLARIASWTEQRLREISSFITNKAQRAAQNLENYKNIDRTLRMVRNLISGVNAEYGEDYVRVASSAVLSEVEKIERLYSRVSQELYQKEISLKKAVDTYVATESRIINNIVKP
ncbi:MAG: hypothetical protein M0Z31_00585 [Clostridia bacterium]|nr:hypothetical protein [Clostridia bacterium]